MAIRIISRSVNGVLANENIRRNLKSDNLAGNEIYRQIFCGLQQYRNIIWRRIQSAEAKKAIIIVTVAAALAKGESENVELSVAENRLMIFPAMAGR